MKAKSVRPTMVDHIKGFSRDKDKAWNRELDAYAAAKRQGIQPAGTKMEQVEAALAISDKTGLPFRADK